MSKTIFIYFFAFILPGTPPPTTPLKTLFKQINTTNITITLKIKETNHENYLKKFIVISPATKTTIFANTDS
jgi:hypothetical protein